MFGCIFVMCVVKFGLEMCVWDSSGVLVFGESKVLMNVVLMCVMLVVRGGVLGCVVRK